MTLRFCLAALAALLTLGPASAQDLLVTGVIDGPLPGGQPKAVELFVLNDIADLSAYGIGSANNGGGTDGQEFTFPADAASAGDFLYVASVLADFQTWFGQAADYESGAANVNGNDAIEVFFNGAVVDIFGEIDTDGEGQAWEYLDGWAYRVNGTGPDGSTFALGNWTFSGINALDGETSNGTAAVPFPIGTYQPEPVGDGATVAFTAPAADGDEGTTVDLTVELSVVGAPPAGPITVAVTRTGGTADGADVTLSPTSGTFASPADGDRLVFQATLAADDGVEGSETALFTVTVTAGDATVGSPRTFTLTIGDTDEGETITLAEARAAGPGATVTVEGTVSRAMGSFTYFQDATGGLSIRQPAGAFFDAVAAGAIAPGVQITVTGTLSEFFSLLQINEGDLSSFEVGAAGDAPAAQPVTLAELVASGEDYESELVSLGPLFFDPNGRDDIPDDVLAPATTYGLTDEADGSEGNFRVPNEADGELDGTVISGNGILIDAGIVSQFSSADPAAGYQILGIGAGDVSFVTIDAVESGDTSAFSLVVANPLRGAASVRFATGAPGEATLALYDALGRRVTVLADGPTTGDAVTVELDVSRLAAGLYVLRLSTADGSVARTLSVVR